MACHARETKRKILLVLTIVPYIPFQFFGSLYKIVIEPRERIKKSVRELGNGGENKAGNASSTNASDDYNDLAAAAAATNSNSNPLLSSDSMGATLFAFGIAIPCVFIEAIYVVRALEIENACLIMVFLGT
eukprot:CAMPEP_0168168634 /NCGR_PEP_ID=MMETSP0139_2-20121125/3200_1 /TAXON_ID=44445 /ORGANISM="Pseudo-nitzschia australis, Strain 10249 10 AB" /LENGTH=130 /DNA_ID=CAMNT_0008085981 /DNA_START=198 /DNA_END=587 /DNA_ORIENTATION=-